MSPRQFKGIFLRLRMALATNEQHLVYGEAVFLLHIGPWSPVGPVSAAPL
jgi:hypothetical protein